MAMPNGRPTRRAPSSGSSAATICRSPLVDLETGSCRDGLHPDRPNENRGGESVAVLPSQPRARCARSRATSGAALSRRAPDSRLGVPELMRCLPSTPSREPSLSQATFLNRQALYLRPDPARVVVRPFKPATEPRDLNPTDKTRANHIVDRVLALDAEHGREPTGRRARKLSRPPPQSARDFRGARRRDGRRVCAACRLHARPSAS